MMVFLYGMETLPPDQYFYNKLFRLLLPGNRMETFFFHLLLLILSF